MVEKCIKKTFVSNVCEENRRKFNNKNEHWVDTEKLPTFNCFVESQHFFSAESQIKHKQITRKHIIMGQ